MPPRHPRQAAPPAPVRRRDRMLASARPHPRLEPTDGAGRRAVRTTAAANAVPRGRLAPVSTAPRPRGDRGRRASPRREAPASVERPTRRGAEGARRSATFGVRWHRPRRWPIAALLEAEPPRRTGPDGTARPRRDGTAMRGSAGPRSGATAIPAPPRGRRNSIDPGPRTRCRSRSPPSRLLLARITVGRLGNLARHARPPAMRPPAATPRGARRVPASDRPGAPARLAPDALDRAPQAPHIAAMPAPLHP